MAKASTARRPVARYQRVHSHSHASYTPSYLPRTGIARASWRESSTTAPWQAHAEHSALDAKRARQRPPLQLDDAADPSMRSQSGDSHILHPLHPRMSHRSWTSTSYRGFGAPYRSIKCLRCTLVLISVLLCASWCFPCSSQPTDTVAKTPSIFIAGFTCTLSMLEVVSLSPKL